MTWLGLASVLAAMLVLLPAGCRASGPSGEGEYEAAMRRLEALIEESEVTEGSVLGLSIGRSKDETLEDLCGMGVQYVDPGLRNEILVTSASDLEKLREAEGLIVDAGQVVVSFEGDEVVQVQVAPIFPRWKVMLEAAATRGQVLEAVGRILDENPELSVRNHAPDADHVRVDAPGRTGEKLLRKYDSWRVGYENDEGYWSLRLVFDKNRLEKIAVWYSPEEVP